MLELFRRNIFVNNFLLLPYIFIVRINAILQPQAFVLEEKAQFLQKLVFLNLSDALLQNIIANLLIFIQALFINHISNKHRLSTQATLFPGLFYVLYISLVVQNNVLSDVLIGNLFIILAVKNFLETYKLPQATPYIFNSGFYIGLASLLYTPYFIFIIFGTLVLWQLRSFKLLENLQFLIGVFSPYFLLFTYKYWMDLAFVDLHFVQNIFFSLPAIKSVNLSILISTGSLALTLLMTVLAYGKLTSKKTIQTQKKIDLIYWLLLFCFIAFLIFNTSNTMHLLTLAFPLSVLVGCIVGNAKTNVIYELLHIYLIGVIFLTQFNII